MVGSICKVISDYGEQRAKQFFASYTKKTSDKNQKIMQSMRGSQIYSKWKDIALRCLKTVQKNTGNIKIVQKNAGNIKTVQKETEFQEKRCINNKAIIRTNQLVLRDLGLYRAEIDGLAGPAYYKAVIGAERILGEFADDLSNCLMPPERSILISVRLLSKQIFIVYL